MRFKTNVRPIAYLCVSLTHVRATDLATWWKRDYAGAFVVDTVQYIDQNTLRHPLYPSAHVTVAPACVSTSDIQIPTNNEYCNNGKRN